MNVSEHMKKKLILAIAFGILISIKAFSQEGGWNALKIGVKGGVNFSNLYVDDVDDENMKAGLNLGLFAKIPVTRKLSFQPEILYSSKGSELIYDNILGSGSYRFNLNYLEMPLLAVINIAGPVNLHAGGYLAFLTSANVKNVDDDGDVQGVTELDEDNFNRFDGGLIGGLNVDVKGFTFGARYNYGLNEVGEKGTLSGQLTSNSKNSVITLYVGFGF